MEAAGKRDRSKQSRFLSAIEGQWNYEMGRIEVMMQRCKLNISMIFLSAIGLSFACSDDSVQSASTGSTETVGTSDEGIAGDGDGAEGQDQGTEEAGDGDGDGNSGDGDGDGNSGDGDGDGNSGDGDGDGDGNSGDGDGDGNSGDGDGDGNSGDGDGDGDGNSGDGDGDGNSGDGDGDGDDGGNNGDGDGDGDGDPLTLMMCGNKLYECGDGLDNDMDGLSDLDDPECTTPCDDDESSFQTALPGQNEDCKSDCYFDENSGEGDDQCQWDLTCDPMSPGMEIGCAFDEACDAQVPQVCVNACVPLVPNGCDCFGCCKIEDKTIYLDGSPDCSLDNLDACQSCTFNTGCSNECGPDNCEVCFGMDPEDLPPECQEPECPGNVTPCFDESDCDQGEFCQTGCCAAIV